jgi:hypothetical protein
MSPTITATFPTLEVQPRDLKHIAAVQALEDRANAKEQNAHAQRLADAVQSGDQYRMKEVLLENPYKHIYK